MRYRICGLSLDSDIDFPELPPGNARAACDLQFHMCAMPLPAAPEWFHRSEIDGAAWLQLGRIGSDYLLRFVGIADFQVTGKGAATRCHPAGQARPDTIRHLYLDQVFPLILSHRGKLALHASAVEVQGSAVAFVGESGRGKSTLAATFSQAGHRVITDDCLVLEEREGAFQAGPTYGGLRLWPHTAAELFGDQVAMRPVADYTRKQRIEIPFAVDERFVPLGRIYFLELAQEPPSSVESMAPSAAFIELVKFAFRLDILDRNRLAEEFPQFVRLANSGALRRLRIHRNLSRLVELRKMILEDAHGSRS